MLRWDELTAINCGERGVGKREGGGEGKKQC